MTKPLYCLKYSDKCSRYRLTRCGILSTNYLNICENRQQMRYVTAFEISAPGTGFSPFPGPCHCPRNTRCCRARYGPIRSIIVTRPQTKRAAFQRLLVQLFTPLAPTVGSLQESIDGEAP